MSGDFCRMCGSRKLRRESRDVRLEALHKTAKSISIWMCENCGEEFLDDASRPKLYKAARAEARRKKLAA